MPCGFPGAFLGLYDKSFYESWSKAAFKGGIPSALTNYLAVSFPTAREFWTTRATDAIAARRGIADFTNRNFVSKDRIFEIKNGAVSASSLYALPVPIVNPANKYTLAQLLPGNGASICQQLNLNGPDDLPQNSPCEIEFIESTVTDSYSPSTTTNLRAASLSLFDQYLGKYNVNGLLVEDGDAFHQMDVSRLPTINRFTIEAAHQFLIPRAVAYGAGLIDHFFRRTVKLEEGNQGLGWVIRNLTPVTLSGVFEIYYDTKDSYDRAAVPDAVWNLSIGPDGAQTVDFPRPADESGAYMLVFRGSVGSEQNVVAGNYAIIPVFSRSNLVPDTVVNFPDQWLSGCNWKSTARRTRSLRIKVSFTWKGQEFSRIVQTGEGDEFFERTDVFCETGGIGPISSRVIKTYTNWIEFPGCPPGSNKTFRGNTVANGSRTFETQSGDGTVVETDARTVVDIDLGIYAIIAEIKNAAF